VSMTPPKLFYKVRPTTNGKLKLASHVVLTNLLLQLQLQARKLQRLPTARFMPRLLGVWLQWKRHPPQYVKRLGLIAMQLGRVHWKRAKKAEKLWPSLPRLDIVEEPDACEKMEQQVGTENRSVVPQGELEEDDVPEYPINGVPPSSSGRRNCTVMPGVGGIACDVDEDESDQVAAENAEDASKELKLLETVVPFCVGGDAMEQKVECTKAAEEAQKTSAFPVFGFSLFAMCTPHTEEVVEEISVVHSETSALTA